MVLTAVEDIVKGLVLLFILLLSHLAHAERLQDVIPYPFYVVQENNENQLTLVDSGLVSLQLRLDMIKRAQKNIEVEYYIFKTDRAGRLLNAALVEAAKRGVKVRILVDKTVLITELNSFHALEFSKVGIELKFYNDVPATKPLAAQFRNHRKLLTVDDVEALTGGRNIGEDYFDMDPELNFTDRDLLVKGPIVKAMRESFDAFFHHDISTAPRALKIPDPKKKKSFARFEKKRLKALADLSDSPELLEMREKIELKTRPLLSALRSHTCPMTTFVTDAPGMRPNRIMKPSENLPYRFLRRAMFDRIQRTTKNLTIVSPYMINNRATMKLFEDTINRGVNINIHTNSLASTDAIYMVANTYDRIRKYAKKDMKIYLHYGVPFKDETYFDDYALEAKWGIHEKTQVYESEDFSEMMIGTYNLDNRSYHFNTELAVFCRGNDEFIQEVKTSIETRSQQGFLFSPKGKGISKDGAYTSIYGSRKNKLFLMRFIALPSKVLKYFL